VFLLVEILVRLKNRHSHAQGPRPSCAWWASTPKRVQRGLQKSCDYAEMGLNNRNRRRGAECGTDRHGKRKQQKPCSSFEPREKACKWRLELRNPAPLLGNRHSVALMRRTIRCVEWGAAKIQRVKRIQLVVPVVQPTRTRLGRSSDRAQFTPHGGKRTETYRISN
jgi:hypothetical protein